MRAVQKVINDTYVSVGLFAGFSLGVVKWQDSQKQWVVQSPDNMAWDLSDIEMEDCKVLVLLQYCNIASHFASSEGLVMIILV